MPSSDLLFNWSGVSKIAKTTQIVYPQSEEEIVTLLKSYSNQVKVIGNGLSFESIIEVSENALLVSLEKLQSIIELADDFVTVEAGISIQDLYSHLSKHGKTMDCSPPVIGLQSVGGALGTGTHGQGLYQSSLSDCVVSLNIVLCSGVSRFVKAEDPEFGAFIQSFGLLGVVTRVTFRIINNRNLYCTKMSVSTSEFVESYESLNRENEYVKAWWFPQKQVAHVWIANEGDKKSTTAEAVKVDLLNSLVNELEEKMAIDTKDINRESIQYKTVQRFKNYDTLVKGTVTDIFLKGIPVKQINCEMCIPLVCFKEMMEMLEEWCATRGSELHYPFIFRSSGASKAWINPSYGRESVYVGFLVYLSKDAEELEKGFDMMRSLQELFVRFDAIPHWGKHFLPQLFNFSLLEKWEEFKRLREKVDPHGRMLNPFLCRIFDLKKN